MMDHKLKTAPRGVDKDHPYIDLLRYKSFAFSSPIKKEILLSEKYVETAVNAFRELHKVNAFLNEAVRDL